MAKIADVLQIERNRTDKSEWNKIHLFKMGDFWRAYEWSARCSQPCSETALCITFTSTIPINCLSEHLLPTAIRASRDAAHTTA